jgi:pimeloyl-ACP methyl ester carboxylesterase
VTGRSGSGRLVQRLVAVVTCGLVVLGVAACGHESAPAAPSDPTDTTAVVDDTVPTTEAAVPDTTSPTVVAPAPTTTAGPVSTAPPAASPVHYEVVPLVDSSRPTTTGGRVISGVRSLPTSVWRPTTPGPHPLVVFAHGYRLGPQSYSRFCSTLAAAGYVVAAPSFPLADASRGDGLDRADIPNEATDVSFVISSLLGDALASSITPGEVAVVGHSDGADVTLMDGYQQGKADPRVRSVVAIAPDAMTGTIVSSSAPLLLVQGDHDSVVPYSNSQQVFAQVQAHRYYLTLVGGDHLPPIAGGTQWTPVLDSAVASYLGLTLGGADPSAVRGALSGLALTRLQTAG